MKPPNQVRYKCCRQLRTSRSRLARVSRSSRPYCPDSQHGVATELDSFRVLDQNGQARLVQPHQISMRRDLNRAIATDTEGHELRINDNMKEVEVEVSTQTILISIYIPDSSCRAGKDMSYISINHSLLSCIIVIFPKTVGSSSHVPGFVPCTDKRQSCQERRNKSVKNEPCHGCSNRRHGVP